jgi:hypothetical protein
MGPWETPNTIEALDAIVEKLTEETIRAVDYHTPDARASPYAKRWLTPDLKSQQKGVNHARRRGKRDTASRAKTVEAVLDFAEASQRFRSRAP